jgi:hypothetical protein
MRSGFIDRLRLLEDLIPEVLTESLRREQIHFSPDGLGELLLNLDQFE